jgi:tRNA dimethylallyltransferase
MSVCKFSSPLKKSVIFVVGPTASGKSTVAACLARKLKGEIISCDSMQIYKGMDILSSQPQGRLLRSIPHHLLSIILPQQEYNVCKYRQFALRCLKGILKKGKLPIFSGGSGLYVAMLVDGIFEARTENKRIRQQLYQQAVAGGKMYLYQRLQQVDNRAALKIHPHDTRRIVRALEVYETTGRPLSEFQAERKGLVDEYAVYIFGLDLPRPLLYARIEQRVEEMFKRGLVAEVKKLLSGRLSKTAGYAIGIRELKDYLAGKASLEEAKALIKRNTRRYAKRQLSWFKKDRRIQWIKVREQETPAAVARRIRGQLLLKLPLAA